jgi:translation initiation factor 1
MARDDARTVYSSAHGRLCPNCGKPVAACACRRSPRSHPREAPAGDGVVRVRRETKGRGGKTVTAIHGVPGGDAELAALSGALKRLCGCGGSVKAGVIEIQGDHRDVIVAELERRGYTVKRAGG